MVSRSSFFRAGADVFSFSESLSSPGLFLSSASLLSFLLLSLLPDLDLLLSLLLDLDFLLSLLRDFDLLLSLLLDLSSRLLLFSGDSLGLLFDLLLLRLLSAGLLDPRLSDLFSSLPESDES